ncbi:hypothetical protein BpHYR1_030583 [Brachionus plicatilis]|uniref:Uncharacterized protein n=1 Tax=Brachionus plicatilis TaxID=10195 RepID=A0A3M7PA14_BRAPC|nr:hypothetical protein BpHYR1_030583 [Brachionus plicatilis]
MESAYDYRFSKNNRTYHKNDYPITELYIGQQNYFLAGYNYNTTSSEQRISYHRSDDTDVEAEEIEAPVYKKTRGVGIIYDPQSTFETKSEVREPGRPKMLKEHSSNNYDDMSAEKNIRLILILNMIYLQL